MIDASSWLKPRPVAATNPHTRRRFNFGSIFISLLLLLSGCDRGAIPAARSADVPVSAADVYSGDGRLIVGRPIPPFRVLTLGGDSISVGGAATQVLTLVNLWDTTCVPCKIEFPALQALYEAYAPRGLRVLAISSDKVDGAVHSFVMQSGATFSIGRDPDNVILRRLRDRGVPQHVLVSPDGIVLWERQGAVAVGGRDTVMSRAMEAALDPH